MRINRTHHGFALLEAMIGVFILGVAALGVALLQAKLIKMTTLSSQQIEASILIQEKIESLRNFSSLPNYNLIISGSDSPLGKNATYNRAWTVVSSSSPSYKNISLTTNWSSSEGINESLTLSSNIAGLDPIMSGKLISTYTPILP